MQCPLTSLTRHPLGVLQPGQLYQQPVKIHTTVNFSKPFGVPLLSFLSHSAPNLAPGIRRG